MQEHFAPLVGCAQWRFAVLHPVTQEPLVRSAYDDFLREYVLVVDDRPVSIKLLYDWGSWCYLICNVEMIDWQDIDREWCTFDAPDPDAERGRKRGRGGSL